jgi:hypothetical protein
MHPRPKVAIAAAMIVGVAAVAWYFTPDSAPVTVAFLRYERVGRDWHAYMEIRNNSSRAISYCSAGPTSTHYIWESPQIEHEGLCGSSVTTLPPKSNAVFRVLVMTTEHDWRVGVDYDIRLPGWSFRVPPWLLDRALRLGLLKSGTSRAWSSRVKRPSVDEMAIKMLETNAVNRRPRSD